MRLKSGLLPAYSRKESFSSNRLPKKTDSLMAIPTGIPKNHTESERLLNHGGVA